MSEDFEQARSILPRVPEKYHNHLAKFLDSLELKEEALAIVRDLDHKFELTLQLNDIPLALEIANEQQNISKLKQIGDLALLT